MNTISNYFQYLYIFFRLVNFFGTFLRCPKRLNTIIIVLGAALILWQKTMVFRRRKPLMRNEMSKTENQYVQNINIENPEWSARPSLPL